MGNFQKTIDNTIIEYKIVVDFSGLVAQMYRAFRFYRTGWGLESLRGYQFNNSTVAQLVERKTVNFDVAGAEPASGAIF